MLRAVAAIACCVLIASASPSLAQTGGTGAIAGAVRDQTGVGIPEADVIVRSTATNEIRQVKTQLSGAFVCPLLLPGDYTLEVRMSGFAPLTRDSIDRQTLVVGRQQFAEQLLRDQKRVLARFDTRAVAGAPRTGNRSLTVNRYLRSVLAFKTDLAYQGIEEGFTPQTGQRVLSVAARWNYNQGPQPAPGTAANAPPARPANLDAPPGGAQPWLRRAMVLNPSLKAFAAAGLYDSLNSCAANAHLVSQLQPPLSANITAKCYDGGHMMYDEPAIRRQVTNDIASFYRSTLGSKPSPRNWTPLTREHDYHLECLGRLSHVANRQLSPA